MTLIRVNLDTHSYPIYIQNIFSQIAENKVSIHTQVANESLDLLCGESKKILIVTNETVAPLYLNQLLDVLTIECNVRNTNCTYEVLMLPDGEQYKNFESLNVILSKMLTCQFSRRSLLVALGGGVIGDMVGFAASVYQRGIDFIQIPTTLLSQVDSSVGGKTAINHSLGKNMIGAFKQPKCVLIDPVVLNTLTFSDFSSGMAEVIKYGLIRDLAFFEWLEANANAISNKEPSVLQTMIARSIQNKVDVVEADEFELGERALLNLGHTFGHAIEKIQAYKGLSHGQAVAVGTMIALKLSLILGNISQIEFVRAQALLSVFGLPLQAPAGINTTQMLAAMTLDKKNINGGIRLILLKSIGSSYVADHVDISLIEQAMHEIGILS